MHHLIVPGINGSGDEHWQTLWQEAWGPAASRISPSSWDNPDLGDWCRVLDRAADQHAPVVLVAHSLGCLAAAAWLRERRPAIRGAFLAGCRRAEFPGRGGRELHRAGYRPDRGSRPGRQQRRRPLLHHSS